MICKNWQALFDLEEDKEGMFSLIRHIALMIDLLDSRLEAISKNYNNPILGYVFIINNL